MISLIVYQSTVNYLDCVNKCPSSSGFFKHWCHAWVAIINGIAITGLFQWGIPHAQVDIAPTRNKESGEFLQKIQDGDFF